MARYSISYVRPGEGVFEHILEAKSDAEARIRFMNLGWVAFTAISINSIALKGDQPEDAKAATRKGSGRKIIDGLSEAKNGDIGKVHARVTAPPGFDPEAEINHITEDIGRLADLAQTHTRAGNHEKADALRAKAKTLAAKRAEITKRNRRK